MTTAAGSGHPSSALSLVHLVAELMFEQMRWDPDNPWNPGNDRLVLSEGHAVPVIYAAYADVGGAVVIDQDEATPEALRSLLVDLLGDPELLRAMGEHARTIGRPDAASRLVDELLRLAGRTAAGDALPEEPDEVEEPEESGDPGLEVADADGSESDTRAEVEVETEAKP